MPTTATNQHHVFQTSFWSPTASIDPYPNFKIGFEVLHKKLNQSISENKNIMNYIQQRIDAERSYGTTLTKLKPPQDEEALTGLSRCFHVVCAESEASAKEHFARADNLHTTALDPLQRFANRYNRHIQNSKQTMKTQMNQFESLVKQLDQTKLAYQAKCKALVSIQPNYRLNVIKLGTRVFHERFGVEEWLKRFPEMTFNKDAITAWLKAEDQLPSVLHDLIGLNFIRQTGQDRFEKVITVTITQTSSANKGFSGFFKRGQHLEVFVKEMLVADKAYKDVVIQVDKMRTRIEEELLLHYEEMGKLELERIETLKQAASLSNTIPRYKETVDNMMLYQETLKPDKDVQIIVEQHRTGQFVPRPILYENYFYGTAHHQLFGVPLDEITRTEGTLVPQFISKGIAAIESGLSELDDKEKKHIWSLALPLNRVHAAREEINQRYPHIAIELLQSYDTLLIVSLIKIFLMALPLVLFLAANHNVSLENQDKESRLTSISKLLTTLPSANYHVSRLLFSHFHGLIKNPTVSRSLAQTLSHILLRPQTESKVSTFERHPQRLIQDLIDHYPSIFTEEAIKAQEENSNRRSIIVGDSSSSSIDSFDSSPKRRTRHLAGHLISSSSTLFEDPDEVTSESTMNSTPPNYSMKEDLAEELASLDSFFLDDD
ncbi:hypothetical protein G6F65_007301 [Rhizopus arrhizus]|nr:hypothetical protein G6F65_007301 [Rhizopus arrhizus]